MRNLDKLKQHINEHPKDWQAKIAYLKARSADYEYSEKKAMQERLARVAKYKRMLKEQNEKRTQQ